MASNEQTPDRVFNVLFLCRGNSVRSIMAECALRRFGGNRFNAFSAGYQPRGTVHPLTHDVLGRLNYSTDGLRSKSWTEFTGPDAPALDFVFSVCDHTAQQAFPAWNGTPMYAHWGVDDPLEDDHGETDERKRKMFKRTYIEIESRVKVFAALRIEALEKQILKNRLDAIALVSAEPSAA